MNYSTAMTEAANALAERLASSDGKIVDLAIEATRVTLDVLERTIFSDGIGRNREDIRIAMKSYFEELGRIDPLDLLGVPACHDPDAGRCSRCCGCLNPPSTRSSRRAEKNSSPVPTACHATF